MAALLPEICLDHKRSSGHFDRGSIGMMDFMPKDLLVVPTEVFFFCSWDNEFRMPKDLLVVPMEVFFLFLG